MPTRPVPDRKPEPLPERGLDPLSMVNEPISEIRFGDILTFLAVRRFGSITGASRELKVTPSQVSKAISRLEAQLGVTLLARGARGVAVSEKALRVIPHLEALVERLRFLRGGEVDQIPMLSVAAPSYVGAIFLPRIARAQPGVRIRGLQMAPPLIRALATEDLFELALMVGDPRLPESWVSESIGRIRKALFGSPELARQLGPGPVAVDRLRGIPFITPVYSYTSTCRSTTTAPSATAIGRSATRRRPSASASISRSAPTRWCSGR
jgi:DNA-binding transcriptional LysR family regulator